MTPLDGETGSRFRSIEFHVIGMFYTVKRGRSVCIREVSFNIIGYTGHHFKAKGSTDSTSHTLLKRCTAQVIYA